MECQVPRVEPCSWEAVAGPTGIPPILIAEKLSQGLLSTCLTSWLSPVIWAPMHKIRQLKYPSIANPATDPAGGPAGEPRLSIPELKLPQKLTASVRATQTSLHKMKLMQISKIFQNTGGADVAEIICETQITSITKLITKNGRENNGH